MSSIVGGPLQQESPTQSQARSPIPEGGSQPAILRLFLEVLLMEVAQEGIGAESFWETEAKDVLRQL